MNSKERKLIRNTLSKNHACYILITCEEPSEDGKMQVEMTYEGDTVLASYILQGAQIEMEAQGKPQVARDCNSKILSING